MSSGIWQGEGHSLGQSSWSCCCSYNTTDTHFHQPSTKSVQVISLCFQWSMLHNMMDNAKPMCPLWPSGNSWVCASQRHSSSMAYFLSLKWYSISLNILIGWTINYIKMKFIKKQHFIDNCWPFGLDWSLPHLPHLRQPVRHETEPWTAMRQTVLTKAPVEVEKSTIINKRLFFNEFHFEMVFNLLKTLDHF